MAGNLYDFHSHILPGMDDGYQDTDSSIQALKLCYAQGIRFMVATPHYDSDEPVDRFLGRRQAAMEQLALAMEKDGGPFPAICLGAEVAYYPNISYSDELHKLCIGSSDYLLLEMPSHTWGMEALRDLQNLCNLGEVNLILAHIERSLPFINKRTAACLQALDLQMQISTEFIRSRRTRRMARKMLQRGPVFLLGTDCHNLTDRQPDMGPALASLRGAEMESAIARAMARSEEIWTLAVK